MPDPRLPPELPADATPAQREAHLRAMEAYATEDFTPLDDVVAANRRRMAVERDHRRFLLEHNPMTSALWLALLKPAPTVLRNVEETISGRVTLEGEDDGLGEAGATSSIVAIAETMVARAIKGDMAAAKEIALRIEGNPGTRKGDVDPEAKARDDMLRTTIEAAVRGFTEAGRAVPGDNARRVEAHVTTTPAE